jgi:uncharacterized membrane-anchored protein
MKNAALFVSGLIFLIVAGLHFYRYYYKWQIVIDNYIIPVDWSGVAGIVTLILALWMFITASKN